MKYLKQSLFSTWVASISAIKHGALFEYIYYSPEILKITFKLPLSTSKPFLQPHRILLEQL